MEGDGGRAATSLYIARPGNHLFKQQEKFALPPEEAHRFARQEDETDTTRRRHELQMLTGCVAALKGAEHRWERSPFAQLGKALSTLGVLQMAHGDLLEAEVSMRQALHYRSELTADTHYNLGTLLLKE
eukprot:gene12867-15206_t